MSGAIRSPYAGVISTSSSATTSGLNITGGGTVVFAAANNYAGGTTVSGATLQLGNGVRLNGSVTGNIADNGLLRFANPTAQTYSGTISGTAAVLANAPAR